MSLIYKVLSNIYSTEIGIIEGVVKLSWLTLLVAFIGEKENIGDAKQNLYFMNMH